MKPPFNYTIFGASGYIGSALKAHLESQGAVVSAPAKGEMPEGDLGRVIYCAGATQDFLADPAYTLRAHVGDFSSLLTRGFDHCWYLSSVRLYDFSGVDTAFETTPVHVESANPRSLFDATKLCGEAMAFHGGRKNVSVARLACVYGGNLDTRGFIHGLLEKVTSGGTESGSFLNILRDYIHIDDVCRALAMNPPAEGLVNFSSGRNVSNAELFGTIEQACGHCFGHRGVLPDYQPPPRIDNRRFIAGFGFQPASVFEKIPSMPHPLNKP